MPSVFAGALFRLGSDRRRRVELRQLNPAVAVRGPHHGDVGTDVVEPDDAVHPTPLDRRLAFQLHPEFGEERFGSLEVVDNDENVVHPLNRLSPERRGRILRQLSSSRPSRPYIESIIWNVTAEGKTSEATWSPLAKKENQPF